jgi:TPP-dependent pyruvate/acetoin dehydrogenase alpha subunit
MAMPSAVSAAQLSNLDLYRAVLSCRLSEDRITNLSKAGEVAGHHSGLNHEAIGVAVGSAVEFDDYVQTSYRSGAFVMHARGLSLRELVLQGFGLIPGIRMQHPGGPRTLRSTGILGGQLPTAVGTALSFKMRGTPSVVVSVIGDGASNEGAIHESFNIAGVKRLPIIFVIENNGIALSTRGVDSTACADLALRGAAYGIPASIVDGSDAVAAYSALVEAVGHARNGGGPALIEMKVTRPGEHASVLRDVRTADEVAQAQSIDGVAKLRERLLAGGELTVESDAALLAELTAIVDAAVEEARAMKAARVRPTDESQLPEAEVWRMAHVSPAPSWMDGGSK